MAFNYPPLLLSGQLDGEVFFNNCPGYSVLTVHSFCAVRRIRDILLCVLMALLTCNLAGCLTSLHSSGLLASMLHAFCLSIRES
ncbi:hypothetical protein HU200_058639 [Digitaria exilis]|uniref:Uncharacterized protein n=1 Tax=Digitaria exilis TaxID=1010633 RepID=A0A835AMJ0_9POAL|nr:hypothetical protein HU200_058639 [Digitaria exilis]